MTYERFTFRQMLCLAGPHSWPASAMPALFGIIYSFQHNQDIHFWQGAVLLAICILMQSGVNTLNDYFDYIKGVDGKGDCLEKNDAILLNYKINPKKVLLLGLGFLGIAGILGVTVVWVSGVAPLTVGIIGGITVLLYSGGPLPLSSLPIGEFVSGFVMGGLIPLGIMAAISKHIDFKILIPSIPFMIGIGLIMMSNNGCDIEKDKAAKRYTLPVLLGREKTRCLYRVLICLWIASIVLPVFAKNVLLGFLSLIMFFSIHRILLWLLKSPLDQEHRVIQMKYILIANLVNHSIYLLMMLLHPIV